MFHSGPFIFKLPDAGCLIFEEPCCEESIWAPIKTLKFDLWFDHRQRRIYEVECLKHCI